MILVASDIQVVTLYSLLQKTLSRPALGVLWNQMHKRKCVYGRVGEIDSAHCEIYPVPPIITQIISQYFIDRPDTVIYSNEWRV